MNEWIACGYNTSPMKNLEIAIVQNSAGSVVEENLERVDSMLADAGDADMIVLPEVFAVRGDTAEYRESAEPIDGAVVKHLSSVAAEKESWILLGSVIEKEGTHIYNTSVLLDRAGKTVATYRKIHLFEARLEDGTVIREADAYEAGDTPVLADVEGWRVGLAMCYDLRFPELFRHYASEGADLMVVPSNFTQRTGRDHWEVLLRARAVENQCFVVAPNQCGENAVTGVASYGHSMAIGPWGEVLCEGNSAEGVLSATLDPGTLTETRERVPALKHRAIH